MALEDYALTTVSTVESELGLSSGTDTSILERLINTYSSLFVEATGRAWHRESGYVEKVVSTGDTRLMVSRTPVVSIAQIDVKGETIDASDYEIEDADLGYIRRKDHATWESTAVGRRRIEYHPTYYEKRVEVTYEGGYVTPKQVDDGTFTPRDLPHDIEAAIIASVTNGYRLQGAPSNIDSESIGSASVSFGSGGGGGSGQYGEHVAPSLEAAIQRYRDRSVL